MDVIADEGQYLGCLSGVYVGYAQQSFTVRNTNFVIMLYRKLLISCATLCGRPRVGRVQRVLPDDLPFAMRMDHTRHP